MQLKDAIILDDQQLKNVLGGSGAVGINCSVTCSNGTTVSITDCVGVCSSSADGAVCSGATAILTKPCPKTSGAKAFGF